MTHKVGAKGQVVVPKRIRERLGIQPGDEVTVEEGDGFVAIHKVGPSESLRGALRNSETDLLAELEREHREEIEAEEREGLR